VLGSEKWGHIFAIIMQVPLRALASRWKSARLCWKSARDQQQKLGALPAASMRLLAAAAAAAAAVAPLAAAVAAPCPNETAFPWCDTMLPVPQRVELLVAGLSREEKAELFASNASGIERIGWPKYNWWSESLHGVARDGMATSFPQIGLVACSMNRTLWHAIGDTTATEGRGKNNPLLGGLYQGLTFWAVRRLDLPPRAAASLCCGDGSSVSLCLSAHATYLFSRAVAPPCTRTNTAKCEHLPGPALGTRARDAGRRPDDQRRVRNGVHHGDAGRREGQRLPESLCLSEALRGV
jgi:hypothetical protein